MKKLLLALMAILLFKPLAYSQLELEDVIYGGKNFFKYYVFPYNAGFKGQSNDLVIQRNDSVFYQTDQNPSEVFAFGLEKINQILEAQGLAKIARMPRLEWDTSERVSFNTGNGFFQIALDDGTVNYVLRPEGAENADWEKNHQRLAYTKDHGLYITDGGEERTVALSEKEGVVYGTYVHRNEFGITKGTFWSPDGDQLAFYRKDESMVSDYPLVNIESRVAELENIKYPMAGMASHHVTVGVYNVASGEVVYLETGEPRDRFFTNVCWTPDGQYILIAELNREQNHMHLNKYDAASGKMVATLFEETSAKWVEPQHTALFIPGKKQQFIWQSNRDGFNHLYVYDLDGKMLRQLTRGEWEVTEVLGFDEKTKNVFVQCTKGGPLEIQACKVSLSNGKTTLITGEEGVHKVVISKDGTRAITSYSSLNQPLRTLLKSTSGQLIRELHQAKDPYAGIETGEVKMVELSTKDGSQPLYGRIVLPVGFDPAKKYPVIVYVYGGPHSQLVKNSWKGSVRGWQLYMAQKGYIAFTLDNRGTSNRGRDFEQAIHRQLGTLEVEDQMQGVDYLKSLPYVDAGRIGVHGWSYGGFMTISLMTAHPEVFKVGVAGGPVIDWKYYEIMYGERYMDRPDENPEGYARANLNAKVNQLEGRLMVIHGAVDPVVVWQHSLTFVRECVKNGVPLDYFVYPRHEHNVMGHDRIHLMQKVSRYFEDFL